jgi:hypothetical protein
MGIPNCSIRDARSSRNRAYGGAVLACAVALCAFVATGAAAAPISLLLPQATAFSFLGHSCGGIQEQAFATGFDPATGYPAGDVYLQTRCGGSGRGGGYHVTTYSKWVAANWISPARCVRLRH